MGKSSKPTIGYWHQLLLYTGASHGPVDAVRAVEWGGEMAWEGNQTTSGDIQIDKPELFGGEKKEGGIVGTLAVRMGEPTQMPHPRLVEMVPGPWPAARGLLTFVYDGIVGALTPYVKTCRYLVSRWVMGWDTPVWQPALCKLGEGMNAAHLAYQVLTNTDWGYGEQSASIIDEANLLAMAQTLADENFGLCLKWSRSESVSAFLGVICQHVGAQYGVRDDRIVFTLYRGDYDVETLPLLDESNIIELEEWSETLVDGSVNEVTVVGYDCLTGKDIARTYANLASIQATGRVVSEKLQMPGLWNLDLVGRVAARECHAKSMQPQRVKVTVQASAGPFVRGEVRAISWGRRQVQRMPVRVAEVDEGTLTDSRVRLVLLQDVAGMAQTSYIAEVGSAWVAPDTTPLPLDPEYVYEATYRDLVGILRPADLALVGEETGYLVALGARPPGPAYNFTLFTRTAAAPFAEVGAGDFSPCGVLAGAIGPVDTAITLNGYRGLGLVSVGEECILGGVEHCRVTAIDPGTGVVGIARGCVDTVPRPHPAGAVVWFPDTYHGYDPTEYLDGETAEAQLRTRTSSGTLAEVDAVTRSVVMAGRQFRPYPPANVQVEGAWPAPASVTGEITVTWAHRDRLLQADQLVEWSASSIGPEPGVQYQVRCYDPITQALLFSSALTSEGSITFSFDDAGLIELRVYSIRDGLECLQPPSTEFDYTTVYTVEAFTSDGTFNVPAGITIVDVLVVAGGGGGGTTTIDGAGGGGAGGVIYQAAYAVTPLAAMPITVGIGGQGAVGGSGAIADGSDGGDSTFGTITTVGGGGGGGNRTGDFDGRPGGSGGGGGGGVAGTVGTGAAGTPGQGNNGGAGHDGTSATRSGGGGGGSAAGGGNAASGTGGTGGAGADYSALFGTAHGVAGVFGAGGGGGTRGSVGGIGGAGGGGNGGEAGAGTNATANTGSGGGGASGDTSVSGNGGNGADGIVLIRYAPP